MHLTFRIRAFACLVAGVLAGGVCYAQPAPFTPPAESFDAKTLYYQKYDLPGLFRMPVEGGPEERIADVQPPLDWQVAPDGIYYFRREGGDYAVARLDPKSGKAIEALKLPPGTVGGTANFTISPDGRWLVFVRTDQMVSELMMIENFR